jgi:hypothetical protein
MARFGTATRGNATLAAAALTVATLSVALILLSIGGTNYGSLNSQQVVTTSINSEVIPAAAAATSCVAPSPVPPSLYGLGSPQHVGAIAFTFVGTNSTCAIVPPSSSGPSSANLTFTLDAPNQTVLNLAIFPNAERGQVTVPSGTNFTATEGSQTFSIPVASDPFAVTPLVTIPGGDTSFHIEVSVPNPHQAGTYTFQILITAFQNSSQKAETYGTYFSVNLDAQ